MKKSIVILVLITILSSCKKEIILPEFTIQGIWQNDSNNINILEFTQDKYRYKDSQENRETTYIIRNDSIITPAAINFSFKNKQIAHGFLGTYSNIK